MNAIEYILAHPEDLEPRTEALPCGATLRIWRGSKLTSAHGVRSERSPVPTGGLVFEVTLPAPHYGPARPFISRLRADKGWDANDARARYAYVTHQAAHLVALNELRDFLYDNFHSMQAEATQTETLLDYAFEHNLHLDVENLTGEQINQWISFLSQRQEEPNNSTAPDTH